MAASARVILLVATALCLTAVPASTQSDIVVIETTMGAITAELYAGAAPITVRNFLAYADDRVYDGGSFFRSVRMDNQPNDSVRIEVIQGGPDAGANDRMRDAIPLERTTVTGLLHVDGAISMARGSPDSARASFFICIGDQPSLDFGGNRNLDGQGFAVFGQVIEGMDVVRAIQRQPVDEQQLREPVRILRVRRLAPAR